MNKDIFVSTGCGILEVRVAPRGYIESKRPCCTVTSVLLLLSGVNLPFPYTGAL